MGLVSSFHLNITPLSYPVKFPLIPKISDWIWDKPSMAREKGSFDVNGGRFPWVFIFGRGCLRGVVKT